MAVSDVFRVKMTAEGREGEWCMTFHYQTLTQPSLGIGTERLALSVSAILTPLLRACLSSSHSVSRWSADKLSGTTVPGATHSEVPASRVGTLGSEALPANNAMVIKIGQVLFPAKSNGQVWMSGLNVDSAVGSVLTSAFRDGVVQTFIDALNANITEDSAGDGLWRLVVLSRKHLIANPGDYIGAAADAINTSVQARVGMMRSRRFGGRRRGPPNPPPV